MVRARELTRVGGLDLSNQQSDDRKVCLWHKKGNVECMCDVCKDWHKANDCDYGNVVDRKLVKECYC